MLEPLVVMMLRDAQLACALQKALSCNFLLLGVREEASLWKSVTTCRPEIVLLDDEVDVYPLCRKMKKNAVTSHMLLCLVSACPSRTAGGDGYKAGADMCFPQPLDGKTIAGFLLNNVRTRMNLLRFVSDSKALFVDGDKKLVEHDGVFMRELIEVVGRHMDTPYLNAKYLSEKMCVSPNSLYRKLKILTGDTVPEFIRKQRIRKGAALLVRRLSVTQVAYMIGFNSPSYFTRRFKEELGCTPSEYCERYL